jgi:hypothetical protein
MVGYLVFHRTLSFARNRFSENEFYD